MEDYKKLVKGDVHDSPASPILPCAQEDLEVMFVRVVLVTTFLAFMSASLAAPADRPLVLFGSVLLVLPARTPTFGVNLRRQTSDNGSIPLSDFPVQCQKGCAVAVNAINTCTTTSCICDPSVDSSLAYCVSCSVNANPTPSVIQTGQQFVDNYNSLCKGAGVSTISFSVTNTVPGTSTNMTASISVSTNVSTTISTTTGTVTPTPALGPTTTISALPQTTSTNTSTLATATTASNDAPVIHPRAALTSIALAMVLSIVVL